MSTSMPAGVTPPSAFLPPIAADASLFGGPGEGEEDEEAAAIQVAVAAYQKNQKNKAAKRSAKVLGEFENKSNAAIRALKQQVDKDVKDMQSSSKRAFSKLQGQLDDKHREIDAVITKFHSDLNARWGEYTALYSKLEDTRADAAAMQEKRRASLKRKIDAVQSDVNVMVAEAEKELEQVRSGAKRVPGVIEKLKEVMMQL